MPRYKLLIEYDGTPYAGWQRQDNVASVQGAIENAIFQFSQENKTLTTAGRTDAGVHALGQVANVDLTKKWRTDTIRDACNAHLLQNGDTISILNAELVDSTFNARFSAIKRHYHYRILNRRSHTPLDAKRVWWVPKSLNSDKMHEAAQRLLGRHDFTTFRSTQCQAKSPIRTLDRLDVIRNGDYIDIYASAQSFLHNQIRSFAGSLMNVGSQRFSADDLEAALHAKDRQRCGVVAPPFGLYLTKVDYK